MIKQGEKLTYEKKVIPLRYVPSWDLQRSQADPLFFHRDRAEIYCITNRVTNQKYVGQTKCIKHRNGQEFYSGHEDRYRQHLANAFDDKRKNDCAKFYEAIRQYGVENFFVTLLETCPLNQINFRERHYIKQLKCRRNGYNMTRGGQAKPWKAKMYARRRKKAQRGK